MLSLNLPLIRLCAISQHVSDVGSVGHDDCRGINREVALLFWATCSTGGHRCSSPAAVGGMDNGPVDGGLGAALAGAEAVVAPFPSVLAVEAGFRLPDRTVPGGLATGFGPPGFPWMHLAGLGAD